MPVQRVKPSLSSAWTGSAHHRKSANPVVSLHKALRLCTRRGGALPFAGTPTNLLHPVSSLGVPGAASHCKVSNLSFACRRLHKILGASLCGAEWAGALSGPPHNPARSRHLPHGSSCQHLASMHAGLWVVLLIGSGTPVLKTYNQIGAVILVTTHETSRSLQSPARTLGRDWCEHCPREESVLAKAGTLQPISGNTVLWGRNVPLKCVSTIEGHLFRNIILPLS